MTAELLASAEKAGAELAKADKILILTHRNPDGDAVGSMSALCRALRNAGKEVRCIMESPVSSSVSWVLSQDMFEPVFEPEYVVAVDVGDSRLLEENAGRLYGGRVDLNIDHHGTNTRFARLTLLDAGASAAAELIYALFRLWGYEVTKPIAESIYLAVSTDTGCFRYGNATADTFKTASELIALGVDNGEINRVVFETKTRAYIDFETKAMGTIETYFGGKCAIMTLSKKLFEETGLCEAETHAVTALPRQIEGVAAGVVFKERDNGIYKISLRSNEPFSAADVCETLGGGGHRLAAGCDVEGPLEKAKEKVLGAVYAELKNKGLV